MRISKRNLRLLVENYLSEVTVTGYGGYEYEKRGNNVYMTKNKGEESNYRLEPGSAAYKSVTQDHPELLPGGSTSSGDDELVGPTLDMVNRREGTPQNHLRAIADAEYPGDELIENQKTLTQIGPAIKPYPRGKVIEYVQKMLGLTGDDIDGVYGPDTSALVQKFKKAKGIDPGFNRAAKTGGIANDGPGVIGINTAEAILALNSPFRTDLKSVADAEKLEPKKKKQIKNYNDVRPFLISNKNIGKNDTILMINGHTQRFELYKGDSIILKGKTSTGAGGFGNKPGGRKTSTGLMQISSIAGKGEELYTVLVGLRPTSPRIILDKHKKSPRGQIIPGHDAEVTTRALVLSGLEKENVNVIDRNIYVHGTNRENFLGKGVSGGCIRVSNENIVKLADSHMKSGDYVYVYHDNFKANTTSLEPGSKGNTADIVKSNLSGMGRSLYSSYEDLSAFMNEIAPEPQETLRHGEASDEEILNVLQKHDEEPNA